MNDNPKPAFPMCPMCVFNQDHVTTTYSGDGVWLHTCSNPDEHGDTPYMWQETPAGKLDDLEYGGVTEEWGVYQDLKQCFEEGEPYLEHGIVEYRYRHVNPQRYELLVKRYGHIAKDESKEYTATSFLGGALGRMKTYGDLQHQDGPATGFFHYNGRISYWTLTGKPERRPLLSWEQFATARGLDPYSWDLGLTT